MATVDGAVEFDALLAAARSGDRDAVGKLFDQFRPWLRAVAAQAMAAPVRAKASGSDLVQDAFIEVQKIFARFVGGTPGELRAWLQAVVANKAADLNRHYLGTEMRNAAREQPADAASGAAEKGRQDGITQGIAEGRKQGTEQGRVAAQQRTPVRRATEELAAPVKRTLKLIASRPLRPDRRPPAAGGLHVPSQRSRATAARLFSCRRYRR